MQTNNREIPVGRGHGHSTRGVIPLERTRLREPDQFVLLNAGVGSVQVRLVATVLPLSPVARGCLCHASIQQTHND